MSNFAKILEKYREQNREQDLLQIVHHQDSSEGNITGFVISKFDKRYFLSVVRKYQNYSGSDYERFEEVFNSRSLDEVYFRMTDYESFDKMTRNFKSDIMDSKKNEWRKPSKKLGFYLEYAPDENVHIFPNWKSISINVHNQDHKIVGNIGCIISEFLPHCLLGQDTINGTAFIDENYQRMGFATELHDFAEQLTGLKFVPHGFNLVPGYFTESGKGFWDYRAKTHDIPGFSQPLDSKRIKEFDKIVNRNRFFYSSGVHQYVSDFWLNKKEIQKPAP